MKTQQIFNDEVQSSDVTELKIVSHNMESGERMASPSSVPSSLHMASSSASSSPAPPSTKSCTAPNPAGSSPLTTCGHLLQMTGDDCLNTSGSSSGFPLLSHPAFGFYTSTSGRTEFGGLGSLGLSALAAHPQFGTFPDFWRPSEAHTRGAAAFFPPLVGLHPVFASNFKSHDSRSGVNGAVNGRSASSPTGKSAVNARSFTVMGNEEKTKPNNSPSQKNSRDLGQLLNKTVQKTKEKKPSKRPLETSSMSGSQSGSLSDSSSDGEDSSSDPDDMEEEEEEDIDEDEDDQSNDSEDSDSESQIKWKVKRQSAALFLQSSRTAEEEHQQHISVIQATGMAACNSPLAQSHSDASLPARSSPITTSFSSSPKHLPPSTSPKHFSHSSSPKHRSVSSSPKPLALCSSTKPLSLASSPKPSSLSSSKPLCLPSLPKPSTLLASQKPSHKPKDLMLFPKHTQPVDSLKDSSGNLPDEMSLQFNSFKLKQPFHSKDSFKQTFSLQPSSQNCNDANLFLNHQPNGAIHSEVQDAPLALITKPRSQSSTSNSKPLLAATSPSYPMPINLSTGSKEPSGSSASELKPSGLSGLAHRSRKTKTPKSLLGGKSLLKTNSSYLSVDLVRCSESDIHSSKDSDSDSLGDDFEDDEDDEHDLEDEDSESSLSESESNLESDSDGSDDDMKERGETEADSDTERTPQKAAKAKLSTHKSSSNLSANCSLLNLHIIKPPSLPSNPLTPGALTSSGALSDLNTQSRSLAFATLPGSARRRRVTDERVLRLPLEFGWQRETRIRTVAGRLQGEVAYFAPCGKKLRQYPDVMKYLLRNGITEISRDNFSFSTKIKVGDFYEAREGPEGIQWFLLAEEEIAPCIIAMDGRRSRRLKSEHQLTSGGAGAQKLKAHPLNVRENNFQDVSNAKLLRKLEAQEIARQAAQIKLMRKLEKQAVAQAAKEAKKQQAIMAAEERRKKREQMKILKQQEKIKRIQQIRMEKELRAQQILEAKRKKKEEAANARILEAEKRNKEKEMRRLQAVILKHQELERHRLDMERERRRQHMMLMKAVETRKKAEEKARLKKEKKDEKRLNKERKLELRRLELEKAKELKKPNEDMCLADHKRLPELSRIPGLVLPGNTFSDCLMVLQFLRSFGKVLGLDINSNILNLSDLQEGLLNIGDSMGKVQDLLVSMLSAALCDPGVPAGHKNKTSLGDYLTNVEIGRENVSEILQIYMDSHCEQTELAALALSLRTKAFQAHTPSQKASLLAFLVNELCCSKAVTSEIDKNIDQMTNLRKDKWLVEGKLRKLRSVHGKRTGKRDSGVGGEDSHVCVVPTARSKCKRKEGDSEEEEDEDDDSEDQGDDDEEEEEDSGGKKGKKAETCEEEDDSVHSVSVEELEKHIEKTYKQQSQIRQKLFDSSHLLRSMMIGQDRYMRRYWVLPQCGGIFVEGMGSGEGYEEVEKEKDRQEMAQVIRIKEEQLEETTKPVVSSPAQSTDGDTSTPKSQQDKDSLNLFLQKPGSISKLSKLLEVAKVVQDTDINSHNSQSGLSAKIPTTASCPSHPKTQAGIAHSPPPAAPQKGFTDKADTSLPSLLSAPHLQSSPWMNCIPQPILHDNQLSNILNEKSSQWFSLLPRSPCDESSVTSSSSPPASSSSPQTISTKSPSSLSPNPQATASYNGPAGINNLQFPVLQQVQPGIHPSQLTLCDVSSTAISPSLPFPGTSLPPVLDLASQHAEGNGNKVLFLVNNNTVNKSETSEALNDQPPCASFPAVEVAKTQDYPRPQPIPQEMLEGWWQVSDMQELHGLVKALHSRGIREKVLQKQLQKHMEYMTQLCSNRKDAIDVAELEKQEVNEKTVENWCVEEQAMEVDISLLQQVEDLERKVVSAGLQIKGWIQHEPQSEREDLVYHEHKFLSSPTSENKVQTETSPEQLPGTVVRWPNNPLDIAVTRLAELERNIDRSEEEVASGMRLWRKALSEVRSSAQLSLCIQQLQKSIAWERSIMKVHCQICHKGDNGELLLLCDGCDKGCHTYCHKPKITTVPDGDWFCPTCVKESGHSPRSRKQQSRTAGGGKKSSEVKRNSKPSVLGELIKEEAASSNSVPKKGMKEFKRRKRDESPTSSQAKHDSPVSCAKKGRMAKENANGLVMCRELLAELESHQDAWPFLTPVNHKAVPGYRKVIKKPMDFSTIREKLVNNQYLNLETFIIDVNLVFDNCERFNEDDSEIGRAGHSMRSFFDKRWTELLK